MYFGVFARQKMGPRQKWAFPKHFVPPAILSTRFSQCGRKKEDQIKRGQKITLFFEQQLGDCCGCLNSEMTSSIQSRSCQDLSNPQESDFDNLISSQVCQADQRFHLRHGPSGSSSEFSRAHSY